MPDLIAQPTGQPTRKATASMIGGGTAAAIVTVADWILGMNHLTVPVAVDGAFIVLVSAAAAWFTRERTAP